MKTMTDTEILDWLAKNKASVYVFNHETNDKECLYSPIMSFCQSIRHAVQHAADKKNPTNMKPINQAGEATAVRYCAQYDKDDGEFIVFEDVCCTRIAYCPREEPAKKIANALNLLEVLDEVSNIANNLRSLKVPESKAELFEVTSYLSNQIKLEEELDSALSKLSELKKSLNL